MLNLMYITNRPEIAQIAESAGVDRIFVDLEYIGKADRQGGMDTVQSKHTLEDVKKISKAITMAELLVRVNPIHEATQEYCSSKEEIDTAIANGADILMLPFFKTLNEVAQFLTYVDGRVKTMLLVETPEAVAIIDEILQLKGIDYIHIGLNDLSLGYGMKFMFQLLVDGTVERLCTKFREKGISYGFGGIASLGKGMIPAEMVIREHYRLGSTCAILSRSFCNVDEIEHLGVISSTFVNGIREIRTFEEECQEYIGYFMDNKWKLEESVKKIIQ
ncbi:aldolase/citrate lyase family protein [Murimonas intestini]|uniref:aldolase/citrate lyase family protein n=1 Tax=Murimonas intestini TaxID=1337051 RepID=UPI0011DE4F43|nr:aldolase/citrate lyase family protein [Murimonas intestini]